MKIRNLLAAMGIAAFASTAQADPSGSISFSDGFAPGSIGTTTFIVNQMNSFGLGPLADSFGCSGSFAALCGSSNTATGPFGIAPFAGGTIFTRGAYSFVLTGVSSIARTALSCASGICTDQLSFRMNGTVADGTGVSAWSGIFTGNGSCAGDAGTCSNSVTASWSISITAVPGQRLPEPASLALLGIGLAGLGFARRRKS